MKEKAYYEKVNVKNETLLRNLLQKMPPYCKQFFIGIEPTTSSRTRIAYAYDLNCLTICMKIIHYAQKRISLKYLCLFWAI